jgi:hypothetical protein
MTGRGLLPFLYLVLVMPPLGGGLEFKLLESEVSPSIRTVPRPPPFAPNPSFHTDAAMPSTLPSGAQQSQATVAGRRGCNYPPNRRDMNDVWRRGKHEATVRDPFPPNHGFESV